MWASIGSFAIYAAIGYRAGGVATATLAGLAVGLIDATVGEMISSAIGPVRSMPLAQTRAGRAAIAAEVVVIATMVSCLGALAAKWVAR